MNQVAEWNPTMTSQCANDVKKVEKSKKEKEDLT